MEDRPPPEASSTSSRQGKLPSNTDQNPSWLGESLARKGSSLRSLEEEHRGPFRTLRVAWEDREQVLVEAECPVRLDQGQSHRVRELSPSLDSLVSPSPLIFPSQALGGRGVCLGKG